MAAEGIRRERRKLLKHNEVLIQTEEGDYFLAYPLKDGLAAPIGITEEAGREMMENDGY